MKIKKEITINMALSLSEAELLNEILLDYKLEILAPKDKDTITQLLCMLDEAIRK